jgi:hypothetical protein
VKIFPGNAALTIASAMADLTALTLQANKIDDTSRAGSISIVTAMLIPFHM